MSYYTVVRRPAQHMTHAASILHEDPACCLACRRSLPPALEAIHFYRANLPEHRWCTHLMCTYHPSRVFKHSHVILAKFIFCE